MQALEEHINRERVMNLRLVEERNAILGISAPYEPQPPSFHGDRAQAQVHASYSETAKANAEAKSRSLLPPSSRSVKTKETHSRTAPYNSAAAKKAQESGVRKGPGNVGSAQYEGCVNAVAPQQSEMNPLKTWGCTGKRQPSRPRQKA